MEYVTSKAGLLLKLYTKKTAGEIPDSLLSESLHDAVGNVLPHPDLGLLCPAMVQCSAVTHGLVVPAPIQ